MRAASKSSRRESSRFRTVAMYSRLATTESRIQTSEKNITIAADLFSTPHRMNERHKKGFNAGFSDGHIV